jgi:hypothetical protein
MAASLGKALLKCEISKGMFDDERAVKVSDYSGEVIEMFAWETFLKDNRLVVRVLGENAAGAVWVTVPATPFNSGPDIVVRKDDLVALDVAE